MRDEIDEAFRAGKCLGRIADKSEIWIVDIQRL